MKLLHPQNLHVFFFSYSFRNSYCVDEVFSSTTRSWHVACVANYRLNIHTHTLTHCNNYTRSAEKVFKTFLFLFLFNLLLVWCGLCDAKWGNSYLLLIRVFFYFPLFRQWYYTEWVRYSIVLPITFQYMCAAKFAVLLQEKEPKMGQQHLPC